MPVISSFLSGEQPHIKMFFAHAKNSSNFLGSSCSILELSCLKLFEDAEKHGEEKGMEKIAKQMLNNGEDIENIIKYTGLSREHIEKLQ